MMPLYAAQSRKREAIVVQLAACHAERKNWVAMYCHRRLAVVFTEERRQEDATVPLTDWPTRLLPSKNPGLAGSSGCEDGANHVYYEIP